MPALSNFVRDAAAAAAQAPNASAPNVAQIILPPGLTLAQYENMQYYAVAIAICVACAFALVGWDYVVLLRDELKLYQTSSKHLWKQPATWAFIVLRYSAFVSTLSALFFTSIQSDHCQTAVIASQTGVVLVVASAGIIFCSRVAAIYANSKPIIALLVFLWGCMVACWVAVASQYSAVTGPATPFGSNCQMADIVSWAPISYASHVAFDVIILVLTVAKLTTNAGGGFGAHKQSAISRQIYRDNLFYFLATTATNITVLSIQALDDSYALIKPTAVPFSTVITVTMAQRVYLNLKLYHTRAQRVEAGLPPSLPSHSQTASTGSAVGYPPRPPHGPFVVSHMAENGRPGVPYHARVQSADSIKKGYPMTPAIFVQRETLEG
ncbi:hypothetical protein PUNSTDRAFT_143460 [Punctularia strigosozonata HHB-11173 SS5]|uniref:uncharacterized protein n=1 Tax=Punctularia strigosozonata (strain HHB-11173) TaxID=741275 RepID=UPI0004416895|nr:uncharacterized protein PUNSTDRAFT_143460 [Punctularia strigosozonata HHB-11173 SS5]EIN08724.1 hypothetical protein PUNSTDRAFT_143460 [Punctularia strigosozonata HHB-11173 SS5]